MSNDAEFEGSKEVPFRDLESALRAGSIYVLSVYLAAPESDDDPHMHLQIAWNQALLQALAKDSAWRDKLAQDIKAAIDACLVVHSSGSNKKLD